MARRMMLKEVFLNEIDKRQSANYYGEIQKKNPELFKQLTSQAKLIIALYRAGKSPTKSAKRLAYNMKKNKDINPIRGGDTLGVQMFIDMLAGDNTDSREIGKIKRFYNDIFNALLRIKFREK
jgi:hypothetical protein